VANLPTLLFGVRCMRRTALRTMDCPRTIHNVGVQVSRHTKPGGGNGATASRAIAATSVDPAAFLLRRKRRTAALAADASRCCSPLCPARRTAEPPRPRTLRSPRLVHRCQRRRSRRVPPPAQCAERRRLTADAVRRAAARPPAAQSRRRATAAANGGSTATLWPSLSAASIPAPSAAKTMRGRGHQRSGCTSADPVVVRRRVYFFGCAASIRINFKSSVLLDSSVSPAGNPLEVRI